jgi:hypothetical protein
VGREMGRAMSWKQWIDEEGLPDLTTLLLALAEIALILWALNRATALVSWWSPVVAASIAAVIPLYIVMLGLGIIIWPWPLRWRPGMALKILALFLGLVGGLMLWDPAGLLSRCPSTAAPQVVCERPEIDK